MRLYERIEVADYHPGAPIPPPAALSVWYERVTTLIRECSETSPHYMDTKRQDDLSAAQSARQSGDAYLQIPDRRNACRMYREANDLLDAAAHSKPQSHLDKMMEATIRTQTVATHHLIRTRCR